MTAIFLAALTMGMIGSFHCIGMCGPLAFSLPLNNNSDFAKFAGSLIYNLGRIITYSCLGLLFGLAGKSFSIFGFQQWLSVTVGVGILFFLILPKKWKMSTSANNIFSIYNSKIRSKLGQLFLKQNYQSLFTIGLLNGLLPCGLIYMAIAGAIVSADPVKSAFFMTSFGLGTLPVMWSVSFFGNYIGIRLRKKIRNAYPVMVGLMACMLIIRGMGLGIPFVSPAINRNTHQVQPCYPVIQNANYKLK